MKKEQEYKVLVPPEWWQLSVYWNKFNNGKVWFWKVKNQDF
jgi:hypothetical protein